MPLIQLQVTGTFADIQSAKSQIGSAITNAGGTIQGQLGAVLAARVNTLNDIPSQPMKVSATVLVPANSNLQTLLGNLQTIKTNFPALAFTTTYSEAGSV